MEKITEILNISFKVNYLENGGKNIDDLIETYKT
jgi:hypothetical protein